MTGQCSICLNPYRDPISIPCGHIYCLGCLNAYANAPAHEGLKASCPTCRQEFYFVTPDVRILPSKFHPFIMNHMRRVYITPSEGHQELVQQNEQLRAQVDNLKSQEEELLARNDRLKRQRDSCKRKERENAQERQQLERELAQVRRELEDARLVYTQASNAAERFRDYNAHQEEELCQLSELVDRLAHERDEADELARAAAQENAVRARAQRALEERFNRCMQENRNLKRKHEELEAELNKLREESQPNVRRREGTKPKAVASPPLTRARSRMLFAAENSSQGAKRSRIRAGAGTSSSTESEARVSSTYPRKKARLSEPSARASPRLSVKSRSLRQSLGSR